MTTRLGSDDDAPPDNPADIARDVAAIARIDAVPTLLKVLCDITGMGFAAVARVSAESWTACAVRDTIEFGLRPGGQLELNTTLCAESRAARTAIVIDHASVDPKYRSHHTPRLYQIESYVSVPIVLKGDRYFGNLCAIDPKPAVVSDPKIIAVFQDFAQLIGLALDAQSDEAANRQALLDERAAGELREQFIAILGHDLRNPLQSLMAGCEYLLRAGGERRSLELLGRMKGSAQRMSALINDVLDFARGKLGGGIGVQIEPVAVPHLGEQLTSVVREFRDARPDRAILASVDIRETVSCDARRVQQLLSNLLANALTHGRQETPVRFSARIEEGSLVLEVWNDGEPIPLASQSAIFEPFWRNTTSAHREGLGLGLHICAQIVRAHDGRIGVISLPGSGTQFTVTLPCAP